MKIVIQCANGKIKNNTKIANHIQFVANPEAKNQFRPDDLVPKDKDNRSWRELLADYNKDKNNPWDLIEAGKIYKNRIYKELLNKHDDVYILSAGWGLIKSDFLIPHYNITFSNSAPKINRRKIKDSYKDFNHLSPSYDGEEEVLFFGGGSYLTMFYDLTKDIANKNIKIYHATDNIEKHPEYSYIKYPRCFTNWHYQAVKDILLDA